MIPARRWLTLLSSMVVALALVPLASADEAAGALRQYDGQWISSQTESTYTIKADGDLLELVSLVDDDGEEYIIKYSSWNGRTLRWKYFVPSTGYTVEEKVSLADADQLTGEWLSTDPDGGTRSGEETWQRVPAAPPADVQALDGDWLNESTQATYTINVDDGHVILTSVVDDDLEVYEVQKSSSNGRVMRWKYFVPSTRYTVEEEVRMSGPDTLEGEWTSTDPEGNARTGTDRWTRIVETEPAADTTAATDEANDGDSNAIADKLGGSWLNISTDAVYTVAADNGHVELISVVDDDEEEFQVQKSSWNGRTLRWKYKVPSTGYIVEEEVHLEGPDTLSGAYKSTAPDGTVNENDDIWTRIKR
jgi:hypothetical protein